MLKLQFIYPVYCGVRSVCIRCAARAFVGMLVIGSIWSMFTQTDRNEFDSIVLHYFATNSLTRTVIPGKCNKSTGNKHGSIVCASVCVCVCCCYFPLPFYLITFISSSFFFGNAQKHSTLLESRAWFFVKGYLLNKCYKGRYRVSHALFEYHPLLFCMFPFLLLINLGDLYWSVYG